MNNRKRNARRQAADELLDARIKTAHAVDLALQLAPLPVIGQVARALLPLLLGAKDAVCEASRLFETLVDETTRPDSRTPQLRSA